jgi:hypothetical protein
LHLLNFCYKENFGVKFTADCGASGGTCQITDGQGTGLTVFGFVATLNATKCVGHDDWRVPNIRELESIADYATSSPAVALAFNGSDCAASCTDVTKPTCSCTAPSYYWSSTPSALLLFLGWSVDFYDGSAGSLGQSDGFAVRAVRGFPSDHFDP